MLRLESLLSRFGKAFSKLTGIGAALLLSLNAHALVFTVPAFSGDGNIAISWSGGHTYSNLYLQQTDGTWGSAISTSAGSGSFTFNAAKDVGTYTYKLFDCLANQAAAPTCTDTIKTVKVLKPPISVMISMSTATGIADVWWSNIAGAVWYEVQPRLNGNSLGASIKVYSPTVEVQYPTLPLASSAGNYSYTVKACIDASSCTPVTASAAVLMAVPPVTTGLKASLPNTAGNFTLQWSATSNATGYIVNENNSVDIDVGSATTFSVTKTTGTYVYKVRAKNVVGSGPDSDALAMVIGGASAAPVSADMTSDKYDIYVGDFNKDGLSDFYFQGKSRLVLLHGDIVTPIVIPPLPSFIIYGSSASTFSQPVEIRIVDATFNSMLSSGQLRVANASETTQIKSFISTEIPAAPQINAPSSAGGSFTVSWTDVGATTYVLVENGVEILRAYKFSQLFDGTSAKTPGAYSYQVRACKVYCGPLSSAITTIVSTANSSSSVASSSSSAGSSLPEFNFQADAPSNFTYALGTSGVPDVGSTQYVATTQGDLSVSNGAAQYSVKLDLPPAVRDLKPSLSLNYNSRGNAGLIGVGWSLNGLSAISRCRTTYATEGSNAQDSNPRFTNSDRLCLDGQKLVLASQASPANDANYWANGVEYKTEIDNFSKIVAYSSDNGAHAYFKVTTKDGRILSYGANDSTQNSRIRVSTTGPITTWALDKVEDAYGNNYTITYNRDIANGDYYPLRINFSPTSAVVFKYQKRKGLISWGYEAGYYFKHSQQIESIVTYTNVTDANNPEAGTPVKKYSLEYLLSSATNRDLLNKVSECGYDGGSWRCAKPLTFEWQPGDPGFAAPQNIVMCGSGTLPSSYSATDPGMFAVDMDGDGYTDLVWPEPVTTVAGRDPSEHGIWQVARGSAAGCFTTQLINSGHGTGQIQSVGLPGYGQPIKLDKGYGILAVDNTYLGSQHTPSANVYVIRVSDWSNPGLNTKVTEVFKPPYDDTSAQNVVATGASIVVGDFNNDGYDDFYFNRYGTAATSVVWTRNNSPWVDGGVNFNKILDQTTGSASQSVRPQVTAGDFNSDGLLDIQARGDGNTLGAWLNDGTGKLVPSTSMRALAAGDGQTEVEIVNNANLPESAKLDNFGWHADTLSLSTRGDIYLYHPFNYNGSSIDVNGDGLPDYVVRVTDPGKTTGTWRIYINTGTDYAAPIDTGISTGSQKNQLAFQIDYNNDGLVDLVTQSADGTSWQVLLSSPTEDANGKMVPGFKVLNVDPFQSNLNGLLNFSTITKRAPVMGDINNTGAISYAYAVWANGSATWKILAGKTQKPDVLTKITDGFNAQTTVDYSTLAGADNNGKPLYTPEAPLAYPQTPANRALQVVKKVSVSDGLGDFNSRYFNYTGAKMDNQGRGFLGFANIQVTDVATGVVTSTDYRQTFPYIGRVDTATVKTTAGNLISYVKNVYDIQANNPRFPYVDYTLQKSYQLTTADLGSPLSATKIKNTFDACGNLTEQITSAGTGISGSDITGMLGYSDIVNTVDGNGTADCSDDFVTKQTQKLAKTSPTDDLRTQFTDYEPNTQREIAKITKFKDTTQEHSTTFGRNANGVITSTEEAAKDIDSGVMAARKTTFSSFTSLMYPQTLTYELTAGNHISTLGYDTRFGEVNSIATPDGQLATKSYDYLGRLTDEYSNDQTHHELISFYCPSSTVTSCPSNAAYGVAKKVTNPNLVGKLGEPLSIVFYDILQREIRQVTYGMNGKAVVVDKLYRKDGRIDKVSEPYLLGATTIYYTTYSNYDALGHALNVTSADGGSQVLSYAKSASSLKVSRALTVVSATKTDTQTTDEYINAIGQTEKVVDALLTPVTYTYNSLGRPETTIVNSNAATAVSVGYDIQGNQTHLVDPDAGVIDFEYNGFGEMRRQTWQKSTADAKSMSMGYDQLGRIVKRTDTPASGKGAVVSYDWLWDTKQKGRLTSETGNNQTITYGYDGFSRVRTQTTNITGLGDRVFTYDYDNFSRPIKVTYPNNFAISRQYHAAGMEVQVQDVSVSAAARTLWALGSDMDDRGNFNNQLWGNGVVTKVGFDTKSGRITSIKSGRLSTTNKMSNLWGDIQALGYDYDSLGNLQYRTSQRTNAAGTALENLKEEYTYDRLNRLKTSNTSGLFARYQSYDYNELGNLTNRSNTAYSGGPNSDIGTLNYAQINNAGVHAVTSAGGVSYQYDKYGNMTTRGNETVDYDVFNKATKIAGNNVTTIDYDANHNRFRETSAGVTTYTFSDGLYEEIVEGTKTTQKSYVDGAILNTQVVSNGALASNDVVYLHSDNLGSAEAITNRSGSFVDRMSFSDWGKRQQSNWQTGTPTGSFPTAMGYTGHHELDKHSLVHMGGRVYDPAIGRFMSADLFIQSPYSSQSFNRYSYVSNNPLSAVDPSGYEEDCPPETVCITARRETITHTDFHSIEINNFVSDVMNGKSKEFSVADNETIVLNNGTTTYKITVQPEPESKSVAEVVVKADKPKNEKSEKHGKGTSLFVVPVLNATHIKVESPWDAIRDGKPHVGVDLIPFDKDYNKMSAVEVMSGTDGKVQTIWSASNKATGLGNAVTVKMGNLFITYAHLSKINSTIKAGQELKAGASLGNTGCTGRCSGEHLHIQVKDTLNTGPNSYSPGDVYNSKGWVQ